MHYLQWLETIREVNSSHFYVLYIWASTTLPHVMFVRWCIQVIVFQFQSASSQAKKAQDTNRY